MLIVNADDWGGWQTATNAAFSAVRAKSVTSVSAMVFMQDSERGALIAGECGVDVGLHLNFDLPFTGACVSSQLRRQHQRLVEFFRQRKLANVLYSPSLRDPFRQLFDAQREEFVRLYQREPTHYDGHHHRHLCANMLLDRIIPSQQRVRTTFSFGWREKPFWNVAYRRILDNFVRRCYVTTDRFFALSSSLPHSALMRVVELSRSENVELMTHPEAPGEKAFLTSAAFGEVFSDVPLGSYSSLA